MFDPNKFGEEIKELRILRGVNRKEMAKRLHISHDTLKRIEYGHDTTIGLADKILRILGTTLTIGKEETKKPNNGSEEGGRRP